MPRLLSGIGISTREARSFTATIIAAMPTAVAAYIIAEKYQVAAEDSSLGIVVDTALSAVTIPVLIVLLQSYGLL